MYVTNITHLNTTIDYDNHTDREFTNICTNNENKFDIIIPTILLTYLVIYHFYV